MQTFAKIENLNQDNIGDAVSIIAHKAYYLGAIRQIMKLVKQNENNQSG